MKNIRKWLGLEKTPELTFTKLVNLHFGFLAEEFGFSASKSPGGNFYDDPFSDGIVIFRTLKATVTVDLDRDGSVYVFLGSSNASVPPIYYQTTIEGVVDFFSQGKDNIRYKSWRKQGEKMRQWTERQIVEDSQMLRKYSHQIFDKESFEWLDLLRDNKKQAELLYQATPNRML